MSIRTSTLSCTVTAARRASADDSYLQRVTSPSTPSDTAAHHTSSARRSTPLISVHHIASGVTTSRHPLACQQSTAVPDNAAVWYYYPRRYTRKSPKWQQCYNGPYKVIQIIPPVDYVPQKSSKSKPFVVHVDKIKKCC